LTGNIRRHTRQNPCPICGGHQGQPRGHGVRCTGFLSDNGQWAHCSREERAESLQMIKESQTFAHYLDGGCNCGVTHSVLTTSPNVVPEAVAKKELQDEYDYYDQVGTLVYQVQRYRYTATNEKTFFVRRRDGQGTWQWGRGDVERVLYRLPELLAADLITPVYIPEGEADVDRLAGLGLVATCNDGGALKFTREHAKSLKGRRCIVLQDNDEPGSKHALQVAALLHPLAGAVKVVAFPDLDEHGDVSDWLNSGHSKGDLEALVERTPVWMPKPDAEHGLHLISLDQVQAESVSWLWESRIPRRKVTIVYGPPEAGKTHLVQYICATVSRGALWPDEGPAPLPGNVLFYTAEDGHGDTIKPRFEAMGADETRINLIGPMVEEGQGAAPFSLDRHAGDLERAIRARDAEVVVLDPLMAVFGSKGDSNSATDVRDVIGELGRIAEATGCAILAVMHPNKAMGGGDPLNGLSGSYAFGAVARSVLFVAKDREDEGLRVVAHAKSNLALRAPTLGFRITDQGPQWEPGTLDISVNDLMPGEATSKGNKAAEAMGFLKGLLSGGPVPEPEVARRRKIVGLSERTVRRAKDESGVESKKMSVGNKGDGGWFWVLPDMEPSPPPGDGHLADPEDDDAPSTPVPPPPRKVAKSVPTDGEHADSVEESGHLAGASLNSDKEQAAPPPIRKVATSTAPGTEATSNDDGDPWPGQAEGPDADD
jgi:putative DNA primase/helicase